MNEIAQKLTQSGLTEKEALVYHAALSLGPTTILRLSREAGTLRSSTYTIVEGLIRRGLMRREEVGLKMKFIAEDPENLRLVMERKMQDVGSVIPQLAELHKKSGKSRLIRVYEGLDALRNISQEVVRDTKIGDYRYFIGGSLSWKDVDAQWHARYLKWRSRIRIDAKFLFQNSERAHIHGALSRTLKQEVRILPPDVTLRSDILITPHRVIIERLSPPATAIVIEDEEIIHTYLMLFRLLWSAAPKMHNGRKKS
jgi:predicted transcriptional regulator